MAFSEGPQQALSLAVISMPLFLLGYVTRALPQSAAGPA